MGEPDLVLEDEGWLRVLQCLRGEIGYDGLSVAEQGRLAVARVHADRPIYADADGWLLQGVVPTLQGLLPDLDNARARSVAAWLRENGLVQTNGKKGRALLSKFVASDDIRSLVSELEVGNSEPEVVIGVAEVPVEGAYDDLAMFGDLARAELAEALLVRVVVDRTRADCAYDARLLRKVADQLINFP